MTHLSQIPAFRELDDATPFVLQLQAFNIRHVEQLASLLLSPVGAIALSELIPEFPSESVKNIVDAHANALWVPGLSFGPQTARTPSRPRESWKSRGYGFYAPNWGANYEFYGEIPKCAAPAGATAPADIASFDKLLNNFNVCYDSKGGKVSLFETGCYPHPKDQGTRGTCVAFAVSSMLKIFAMRHASEQPIETDFSEQYLYYQSKHDDPDTLEEGTKIIYALSALENFGVCRESELPYKNYVDWSHSLLFDKNHIDLDGLNRRARRMRVAGYVRVPNENLIANLKECLRRNLAVVAGVLVFREAWYGDFAIFRGEIELPIVVEHEGQNTLMDVCEGGHAICLVGYVDNEADSVGRPGGGAFIFKNSWGSDWAPNNEYGRGYGLLPYAYVEKYCLECFTISAIKYAKDEDR